jgi:hypothetical protein
MKEEKCEELVKDLLRRVPAFRDSQFARDTMRWTTYELPYVVFGTFALFLRDLLSSGSRDQATVSASFELLNEMGNSPDPEVADLAAVGVYEILTDSPAAVDVARRRLYGNAIDLFEHMVQTRGG